MAREYTHCHMFLACYTRAMATKRPFSILRFLRLIALLATFLSSTALISTALFYQSSIPARGIILDWAPSDEAFSTGRTPVIAFVDFQNRKQFSAPQSAAGTGADRMGREIPIRYSPDNPAIFRIDTLMGMWATGIIQLLYGLVPFLLLSLLIAATASKTPKRKRVARRTNAIKGMQPAEKRPTPSSTDKPVIRRMR